MLKGSIDLTTNCRAIVTRNRFLTRNISHTKRFSDSREKRDAARELNEKRLEKNETRIARNGTRGRNLLLCSVACPPDL